MTIILRSKSTLTAPAPYLVPTLRGYTATNRYAAMTVAGDTGATVQSVPNATGAGQAAAPLKPETSSVKVGASGTVRTLDASGGYDSGRLVFGTPTTHPATASWTVVMATSGHTSASPVMEVGNYRVTLNTSEIVVARSTTSVATPTTAPASPMLAVFVLNGDASSLRINGSAPVSLALGSSIAGVFTPYFGRSGTGGTTRWIDLAVIPGVVPDSEIAAVRDAWKAYYPILP